MNGAAAQDDQSGGWRLQEELRLGSIDGGGPEQFSDVWDLVADSEGALYVLDGLAQEVRVFTASGEFSHTIGSKGEGPGELTGAAGLNLDAAGRVWVWDPGNNRYSVFERSGELVASYRREVTGVIYPWLGGFTAAGDYLDWGLERPDDVPAQGIIGSTSYFHPVRFQPPATFDTLPPIIIAYEMASNGQPKPLGAGPTVAMGSSDRVFLAPPNEYQIIVRELSGDTLLLFSRPGHAAAVTAAERDSILARYASFGPRFALEAADVPPYKPIVRRIFDDGASRIYVVVQEQGVPEGTAIDVFGSDGVFLGRLLLPQLIEFRSPPPFATGTHLYVVEHDDLDVPYVVRYRIIPPEAP
jgi:hypothetical protein